MKAVIEARLRYIAGAGDTRFAVEYNEADGATATVWWEYSGPAEMLPKAPTRNDLALVALLFRAMKVGSDLHVVGPVSRSLLENAERFVQIWALWRPDLYSPIQVSADEELADRPPGLRDDAAVCAFSGGVDATCSIWRHKSGAAGRASRKVVAGVLVQGFDIPLSNDAAFAKTASFSATMLSDIDVPLVTARTNWKQAVCGDWEMEFGLGIVACLKAWEDDVSSLIIGSCEDYARLVVPWGSHPLTTPLLTARDTSALYDGGELTRTQKVAIISDWDVGYNNLRVCWQGDITGENCGTCEKCVRTKLNAIVSHLPLPATLQGEPTMKDLSKIGPMNTAQKQLMYELLDEAAASGYKGPLLRGIRSAIKRKPTVLKRARKTAGVIKRRLQRSS